MKHTNIEDRLLLDLQLSMTQQFAVDVGHREHPEEKFLSYTRAKVKEALTKVRHVEHIGAGEPTEPTVMPNGTVYFAKNKYSKLSTCGANTGSPSVNCFKCCTCCKPRPREPSDFEKLGTGVVLYFKYLKIMGVHSSYLLYLQLFNL